MHRGYESISVVCVCVGGGGGGGGGQCFLNNRFSCNIGAKLIRLKLLNHK